MNDKEQLANCAVKMVKQGMLIGLGTGSTADCFIEALASRIHREGLQITTVASSEVSRIKAQALGIPVLAIDHIQYLDLYVDGADEVAPDNTLLKGQGSDLVREKLLARSSGKFIVIVDQSKRVNRIGDKFKIPIEVMPFAWRLVKHKLEKMGGEGELRKNGGGLAVSSYGSLILDMEFDSSLGSKQVDTLLNNMPGIVEHGIFQNLASIVLLAENGKVKELLSD